MLIGKFLGGSQELVASLAPKSVTAPIAMGLAEKIGGAPFLTAALVIATGIFGAIVLSPLMRLLQITDKEAVGMAAGVAAHGIGTARAFQIELDRWGFFGNRHGPERRPHQRDSPFSAAVAGFLNCGEIVLRRAAADCKKNMKIRLNLSPVSPNCSVNGRNAHYILTTNGLRP